MKFSIKYLYWRLYRFVDSDDYIELNMFEKIYKKAINENLDMLYVIIDVYIIILRL